MKQRDLLSETDIKNYLEGNLTEKEMHSMEQCLLNSELNEAALEGFQEFPGALKRLEKYRSKFKRKNSLKGKEWWKNNILSVGIFSILVIISVIIYNNYDAGEIKEVIAETTMERAVHTEALNLHSKELSEIKNAIPIAEKDLISYRKTVDDQMENTSIVANNENSKRANEKIELINRLSFNKNKIQKNEDKPIENALEIPKAPTNFIFDLKVVDYSQIYTPTNFSRGNLRGLEAKYEEQPGDDENIHNFRQKDISYEDFLETALKKFSKSDYKNALIDFVIILNTYPDDVNAHFYGGLCYYNLGKPDKAINFFDSILEGQISTFSQEATWYKALSLEQKGDLINMEIMLQEIIKENGFYAPRAKKKQGI